jgi:beta-phosphoglucomutase-like phosphatase (HAD superfamily)
VKIDLSPFKGAKALLFDLDGTLADTMPIHLEAWRQTGLHFGVHISDQMIIDLGGTPTYEVAIILNEKNKWNLDPEAVQNMKRENYHRIKDASGKIRPIDFVYEFAKANRFKYPMAIGTGSIRSTAIESIDDMKVGDWFGAVITADDVINAKPHPETYLRCADILGIAPEFCQVYEDGPMGIEAALAGGMHVIDILSGKNHCPA